jgi:hypothetical protein
MTADHDERAEGTADELALAGNRETFEWFLAQARGARDAGRDNDAAVYAQMAAHSAWTNHAGLFSSSPLEGLLQQIGTQQAARSPRAPRAGSPAGTTAGRILHVATTLYGTGGHTRMVARWLSQDASAQDVVLTRQSAAAAHTVLAALGTPPGAVMSASDGTRSLTGRADRLRALAGDYDLVILHVHPDDVVPVLAFVPGHGTPPVLLINHADHVFWLGTSITTMLVSLRESGSLLSMHRRGIEATRCAVLPRPLDGLERTTSREAAKAQLGLDPDTVLIATVAAGSKYEPISSPSFLELVTPVVASNPRLTLLAAGPSDEDAWTDARVRTGGRVRALGELSDPSQLHQAADLYIDSYPFSSLTSLMEAASYGNPTITIQGHPSEAAVLGADSPGLDDVIIRVHDAGELTTEVQRLADDPTARRALGQLTRDTIVDTHRVDHWRAAYAAMYEQARLLPPAPNPASVAGDDGVLDQLVLRVQARTGQAAGRSGPIDKYISLLPARERIRLFGVELGERRRPRLRSLLSERTIDRLRGLRRAR